MKVYISGKIGEETPSAGTLAKFKKVSDALVSHGHIVFNPTVSGLGVVAENRVRHAKICGNRTTWYNEILKLDLEKLSYCDAIVMLPDWARSPGALAELTFAAAIGLDCYLWSETKQAMEYCHPYTIITGML
ncbi:MAG: DUF4406 domain-containing protein [Prevotella sp.]|nr:DUF4406 domain-containing protein [Prevotella sp.]